MEPQGTRWSKLELVLPIRAPDVVFRSTWHLRISCGDHPTKFYVIDGESLSFFLCTFAFIVI